MSLVERSFVPKSPAARDPHIPESLLVIGTGSVGYRHLMNAAHLGVPRLSVFTTGRGVSRTRLQDGVIVERDLARAFSYGVIQRVREWLREDAIGEVVSAHARWGEYPPCWQPWRDYRSSYSARADLGALLALSHPIDYLCWLLGDVVHVSATTSLRSGLTLDVEDTALVHLDFKSGARGLRTRHCELLRKGDRLTTETCIRHPGSVC